MDFATLDSWSKSVYDSELEQLRHPLDMVLDITQAFLGLLQDAGHTCQVLFQDSYDGLILSAKYLVPKWLIQRDVIQQAWH